MAEVTVRDLRKGFGETQILKGVDLDVPAGGFCVLVGPSGCGKSTLLRCLAGLEEPDAGSIRIGERDVTRLPPRDRDIAMVFQSYALYPHLTVRENLAFGLRLRKAKPDEITARVAEASAQLGLDPLLDRFPRQLSGGQRQRVAMGRAIVRRPDLFLFDEPLSNLDAALRSQVRVEIRKLHDRLGATSVYVTHDQVEAMTLADVMVVLNGGKVEQMGPPLSVYKKPVSRFVAGFLGSPSMSFLDASVGEGGALRLPDDVTLAGPTTTAQAGSAVAVGVRAEDLRLFDASPWRVEVDVVEALGSETYAHGEGPGGRVVIRLPSRTMVKRGEKIGVAADPDALHVFDAKTGASLRLRARAAGGGERPGARERKGRLRTPAPPGIGRGRSKARLIERDASGWPAATGLEPAGLPGAPSHLDTRRPEGRGTMATEPRKPAAHGGLLKRGYASSASPRHPWLVIAPNDRDGPAGTRGRWGPLLCSAR